MKLKSGFLFHDVNGEHLVVAAGPAAEQFSGLIRNNDTADFIYRLLEQDQTEASLADAVCAAYDAPRDQVEQDVRRLIKQMREAGFLDE